MKTEDLLLLDYSKVANRITIQKALRKIGKLSKEENGKAIDLRLIEEFIFKLCQKYDVQIQWIMFTIIPTLDKKDEMPIYSLSLKTSKEHKWLGTIYAYKIYECYAKTLIKIYSDIKSGIIKER